MQDVLRIEPQQGLGWLHAARAIAEARIGIIACHRFTYPHGWDTGVRQRAADILLIPEQEALAVRCGTQRVTVAPGSAVWLPRERIQTIAAATRAVRFLSIHLHCDDPLGLPLIEHLHSGLCSEAAYSDWVEAIAHWPDEPMAAAAVIAQGIRQQWLAWLPTSAQSLDPSSRLPDELRRAIHAAQAQPASGPEAIARAAGCSLITLRRRFVAHLGLTPAKWLQRQRVQRAAHVLRTTQDALAVVAQRAGFSDDRYLHQCFKAHYGCTPMDYREAGP